MRFLAHAASILVLFCNVFTIDAAPTDAVTGPFANQTLAVTDALTRGERCERDRKWFPVPRFNYNIKVIELGEDTKHDQFCNALWRELKKKSGCRVSSPHGCEGRDDKLRWWFHTALFCRSSLVEDAYKKATGNELGFCGW